MPRYTADMATKATSRIPRRRYGRGDVRRERDEQRRRRGDARGQEHRSIAGPDVERAHGSCVGQRVDADREQPRAAGGDRDVACGGKPTDDDQQHDDDRDEPDGAEEGERRCEAFESVAETVDRLAEVLVDIRVRSGPQRAQDDADRRDHEPRDVAQDAVRERQRRPMPGSPVTDEPSVADEPVSGVLVTTVDVACGSVHSLLAGGESTRPSASRVDASRATVRDQPPADPCRQIRQCHHPDQVTAAHDRSEECCAEARGSRRLHVGRQRTRDTDQVPIAHIVRSPHLGDDAVPGRWQSR